MLPGAEEPTMEQRMFAALEYGIGFLLFPWQNALLLGVALLLLCALVVLCRIAADVRVAREATVEINATLNDYVQKRNEMRYLGDLLSAGAASNEDVDRFLKWKDEIG